MEEDSTKPSAVKEGWLWLCKVNESLAKGNQGKKQRRVSEAPVKDKGFQQRGQRRAQRTGASVG